MIAVDTNILVQADREELALHELAMKAMRKLAEGREAWAMPIFCVGEFLRVVSHARVFDPPTPVLDAMASIESLLGSPSARLLVPGDNYLPLLRQVLRDSTVHGNLVFDAQIAAVCMEYGATTLLTEDRDFSRFSGLTVMPLVSFAA